MTDLIQRAEPQEWGIVEELYPALRRYAAVAAPSDMEPDDLLQEALVRVLRRHRLSELQHPGAYVRAAVVNLANGHYRRRGRERRAIARLGPHDLRRDQTYPSDLAELFEIPPEQRTALYLAEVEGYSYLEIGQMTGCSEAAARKRASRGRQGLRLAFGLEES